MLTEIWDFLFTRKNWTIIDKEYLLNSEGDRIGHAIVLQDQFGNVKKKKIKF